MRAAAAAVGTDLLCQVLGGVALVVRGGPVCTELVQQPDYLERTQLYPAPDMDLDIEMQDLWLETLQQ